MTKFAKLRQRHLLIEKLCHFVVVNVVILISALFYMLDAACVNAFTFSYVNKGLTPLKAKADEFH